MLQPSLFWIFVEVASMVWNELLIYKMLAYGKTVSRQENWGCFGFTNSHFEKMPVVIIHFVWFSFSLFLFLTKFSLPSFERNAHSVFLSTFLLEIVLSRHAKSFEFYSFLGIIRHTLFRISKGHCLNIDLNRNNTPYFVWIRCSIATLKLIHFCSQPIVYL